MICLLIKKLAAYPTITILVICVGAGLLLALKSSGVNIGKYELDLDSTSSPIFGSLTLTNALTCAGLILNSGSTSITYNSSGVSITGPNITLSGSSSASSINFKIQAVQASWDWLILILLLILIWRITEL